jgi:hypothetical protein
LNCKRSISVSTGGGRQTDGKQNPQGKNEKQQTDKNNEQTPETCFVFGACV